MDDEVSEETRALVEKFSEEIKAKITEIRYAVATDTQGPVAARNLGWRMAHGQIIAFTDDDCLPELDWLKEGIAAIDSDFDAISGQMIVPISNPPTLLFHLFLFSGACMGLFISGCRFSSTGPNYVVGDLPDKGG